LTRSYLFTSESVSEGHPDKLADQISDAILDEFLKLDPTSRVACETVLADQFVLVTGEFKTRNKQDFEIVESKAESIVRTLLRKIGYTSKSDGIDPDQCEIRIAFNHQSPHINQGVDQKDGVIGAGDQGLMFGYACDETPELMPLAISLAHKLVQRQSEVRHGDPGSFLRPDAKSQVTVRYVDNKPVAVEKVVISTQHSPDVDVETLREFVRSKIVDHVIANDLKSDNFEVLINPTGRFELGGPNGDTGLTGRKIIVDTYGGSCPHGGGAFSGKDASKVDRSAAYMARYIAKNIVKSGLASRCQVQIAYAIGVAEPVSLYLDTFGTGKIPDRNLEELVKHTFDLTPKGIIEELELQKPIYRKTSVYGHFGREDKDFRWEDVGKADLLANTVLSNSGVSMEDARSLCSRGKTWFLEDLRSCLNLVLGSSDCEVIVDYSITKVIIDTIQRYHLNPEVQKHKDLLDRLTVLSKKDILDHLKQNPSAVWITLGSSISGCEFQNEEISKAINGRFVGIAGASVFNGGYAGTSLYKWEHDPMKGNGSLKVKLVHCYGGLIIKS